MDLSNLKAINEKAQADQLALQRHTENQMSVLQLQETVVKSFQSLTDYLDHKVTKTEVTNQPEEIGTPDVERVVDAIQVLSEMMLRNKLDISPIQDGITQLSEQFKLLNEGVTKLPTEFPEIEIPEQKEELKVTNLDEIDFTTLENAIKGIKMVAEAPQVNVDAPDLSPIKDSLANVIKAIKAIKFPDLPKTDLTKVEKKLDTANKHLKELVEKPVSSGGGGSSWVAVDNNGIPIPIQLNNGAVPVVSSGSATYITVMREKIGDPQTTYIGKAVPGTSTSDAAWQVASLDENTNLDLLYADGGAFTQVYDDRELLIYA